MAEVKAGAEVQINTRVPVEWLDQAGRAAAPMKPGALPFMRVGLSADVPKPDWRWHPTLALVDTGATNSLVDPVLLATIGLPATGKTAFTGNFEKTEVLTYKAILRVDAAPVFIMAAEFGAIGSPFPFEAHAIVGMDLLSRGHLSLGGPDGDYFAFRYPH